MSVLGCDKTREAETCVDKAVKQKRGSKCSSESEKKEENHRCWRTRCDYAAQEKEKRGDREEKYGFYIIRM